METQNTSYESSGQPDSYQLMQFEQKEREKERYQTRYVYLPFIDAVCPQVPGGYVPAGAIYPIPAPIAKCQKRMLPEGAQILRVVSPSTGIPSLSQPEVDPVIAAHPAIAALQRKVEKFEAGQQEPASIAIYLHEVEPIVQGLQSIHARQGFIEVTALKGMPEGAFHKHGINDILFGPEGERPRTAKDLRSRMAFILDKAADQTNDATRIMAGVAREILASVDVCEAYCNELMRLRHLGMEDAASDPTGEYSAPRYSQRDLRALEFAGIARREEFKAQILNEQRDAVGMLPKLVGAILERDEQRDKRDEQRDRQWQELFDRVLQVIDRVEVKQ